MQLPFLVEVDFVELDSLDELELLEADLVVLVLLLLQLQDMFFLLKGYDWTIIGTSEDVRCYVRKNRVYRLFINKKTAPAKERRLSYLT